MDKTTQVQKAQGVSRRSFIGACGVVAAAAVPVQSALPWGREERIGDLPARSPLADVRIWYAAAVDAIVRQWEPRFRFRQFRPDMEDDYEGLRAPPRDELADAIADLPLLREDSTACMILAATTQGHDDAGETVCGKATWAMTQDALDHAERLGYFATPCPEALRFPDLPDLDDRSDDLHRATMDAESARNVRTLMARAGDGVFSAEERAGAERRAAEAEGRVADMEEGRIPARTERDKVEAYVAEREAIAAEYRRRLSAAGLDASWVVLPRPRALRKLDEEVVS
jgi:hypothetical protein